MRIEKRFVFVFWKAGDFKGETEYVSIPINKAAADNFKIELAKMPLNHFFGVPMQLLSGGIVYFSRHEISCWTIREVEVGVEDSEQVANGEAPEVTT